MPCGWSGSGTILILVSIFTFFLNGLDSCAISESIEDNSRSKASTDNGSSRRLQIGLSMKETCENKREIAMHQSPCFSLTIYEYIRVIINYEHDERSLMTGFDIFPA